MTMKEVAKKIIASINPGIADISNIGDGTIKGAVSELNKKTLQYKLVGNVQFDTSKWQGAISCITLSDGKIGFIYGQMTRQTEAPITFGEIVGKIPNYYQKYTVPIPIYRNNGVIYNTLIIMPDGNMKLYYPDFEKLNAPKAIYHFNTAFWYG